MNKVLYFSPTGSTAKIADYAAKYLNIEAIDLTTLAARESFNYSLNYEYIVLCFPVYSQNIPKIVLDIIKKLRTKQIIFLASYGRMSMGDVLNEAKEIFKNHTKVIGGAYIPTKHTYKDGKYFQDYSKLNPLLDKITKKENNEVVFPKLKKNLFSNFFPLSRSRIGVKIKTTQNCNECNRCAQVCPTNSISKGIIKNKTCIRCLSCYVNCPYSGLEVKYSIFLKAYLKKDKLKKFIIYT